MEEINFKEVFKYLLSKWYIILLIFAITFTCGELYAHYAKKPLYDSTTKVVLLNEQSTKLTANDITLSNNLVKTYSEIAKSRDVLSKVAKNLNTSLSADDIAKKLTITTTSGTQLITIKVTDENPETAQAITAELAKVFKSEINRIYNLDNVQIVDQASLPTTPANINFFRQTNTYAAVGLALGLVTAIILYLLDTSIKGSETVENRVGLTVLGIIPNMSKKGK